MRRFLSVLLLAALTVLITLGGLTAYYYSAPGPLHNETTLILPRGTAFKTTICKLYYHGVIDNPAVFALTAIGVNQHHFKAGEYRFAARVGFKEILRKLSKGETVIRKLTIPEGLTLMQVTTLVSQAPALQGGIGLPLREGFLLPETYYYSYGDTRDSVVKRMQSGMKTLLAELWNARQSGLPFSTPEEALTLASIVEKETAIPAERPRVAAVFINRLRNNMPLQSDPTVIYAVTEGKALLNRPLLRNDLAFPSPYNTYRVTGLPPHPIASPGKSAVQAVLQPLSTKELYFVADGKGGHRFAASLEEHNRNVRAFRQGLRENN